MAPRLSIVISQAPSHDASIADVEQAIVTALMFEPGMDPMLIGHIEGIQSGTTDHLCLEGIRGDFVLLGWLPTQTAYDQMARLGIYARPGILPPVLKSDSTEAAQFPAPPEGQSSSSQVSLPAEEQLKRRLYFVDLRTHATRDPKTILQGLKDLLQDRQTKTVTLQLGTKATTSSKPTAAPAIVLPLVPPTTSISTNSPGSAAKGSNNTESHSIPTRAEAHSSVTPLAHDDDDPQWQQLDKLLDDFDSLEI
jgi:hypothetical protein